MKRFNKAISALLLSNTLLLAAAPALNGTVAAATTTSTTTSKQPDEVLTQNVVDKINPYVEVKNNQYVLNDEVKNVITSSEYNTAKAQIASTNQFISESSLVINQTTKTASLEFEITDSGKSVKVLPPATNIQRPGLQTRSRYHYGVNKVTVGWNYIRVYLDKSLTQAVIRGSFGGLTALVAAVTGSMAGVVAAVIGNFVSSLLSGQVKGGIWVDVNWIYSAMIHAPAVTNWGWQ